ncbi:MAG: thiamine diphosphokinase, partial [Planktomarina sp.]|nr:thiamine diphosphokinase [Planktomarina sp.]
HETYLCRAPRTLLIGAGPSTSELIREISTYSDAIVAADGGFWAAEQAGAQVALVVGDMDSQQDLPAGQAVAHITDQETTDFQKCLALCDADVFLGVGFLGGRLDHQLAAFSALLNEPRPVVLIDEAQLVFVVPQKFSVDLEPETPVGFYPMVAVEASLRGVRWPLSNAAMSPVGQIATSNVALGGALDITVDGPGLLAILPRCYLETVLEALDRGFGEAHDQ